jgi:hypothetical protein
MNPTTATVEDPLAMSGHSYPAAAVVDAEKYWWHLARLRESKTRAEAAQHTWSLAVAAAHIADVLTGNPADSSRNPAAWYDLTDYLDHLAMALDSDFFSTSPSNAEEPRDRKAGEAWEHLARAVTRREFAAAWHPFEEYLRQRAGLDASTGPDDGDDGQPLLRAFAVAQVVKAAAAIIDAPW